MKKETIFLISFLIVIGILGYFVIKTLRQYNYAIKVSKGEVPVV